MTAPRQYGVALCGGGPAALAPLVTAARQGRLEELLDTGVLLVEPGPMGAGSMAHYRIRANSLGGPFLEGLDGLPMGSAFDGLRDLPETAELRRWAGEHPPLAVVGSFLKRLGEVAVKVVADHPRGTVCRSWVREVRLRPGGGVQIGIGADPSALSYATARRAILAMGGRPLTASLGADVEGLSGYGDKVCAAELFIDSRLTVPEELLTAISRSGRVAIVGGSHSAWSTADLILRDHRLRSGGAPPQVTIVHRGAVRLFYPTAHAAHADGYEFDPVQDVCPASGRVNRYGGLRGPAHALARTALGLGDGPFSARLVQHTAAPDLVADALATAGAIVIATGYQANLPAIADAGGAPITAATSETGTVVTPRGHLVDVHGNAHPDLLAYGLGAGLSPSAQVGGEPSYRRRADGVWLYQHDIGDIIVEELLGPEPSPNPGPATRSTAVAAQPQLPEELKV